MSTPSDADTKRLIRLFQSETAEFQEERGPVQARLTLGLLAAMLASLAMLTLFLPIDRVVTSSFGQIVTVEPSVVVQPLDPSIIKSINVAEGDRVTKGQLLATLDPTFTQADVSALKLQIASEDAEIERCNAELAGRAPAFATGPWPGRSTYAGLQQALFEQRKAQYDLQIQSYNAQISQVKATIVQLRIDSLHYGDRFELARQAEPIHRVLNDALLDSRLLLLAATDQKTEMQRFLEFDKDGLIESVHQMQSTMATRDAFVQQWRAQTSLELVTTRNQRDAAQQQLDKANKHQDLVRLEAPDDAIVLRIAQLSVGSVLQLSQAFFELALLRSAVEAEIDINPRDIGFIRTGDPTTIKLDPYQFVEHGWAEGQLRWISEGTFIYPQTGTGGTVNRGGTAASSADQAGADAVATATTTPFYKARVRITKTDLKNVPANYRLLPGTTLEADIHVGTRSLFWYLVRNIVRGFAEAMREP